MSRIVVLGGYGVFGSHVARELAAGGFNITIAGRDGDRADRFARKLGPTHRGISADVNRAADVRNALQGTTVAVHSAGPFCAHQTSVLEACLDASCHYVDLADDRGYCQRVREFGSRYAAKELVAVYGCSSLPGISGALAVRANASRSDTPYRARVTLFIGNNNVKGLAAVASLVNGLGRPIAAPQGEVRGFRDREVVPLPLPFGERAVFNFSSPDYDLMPELIGVRSVSVKVGFELRLATYAFAAMARLPISFGRRTAKLLDWSGGLVSGFGTSGGAVMTELFYADGTINRATAFAGSYGQRMAALPAVFVAQWLAQGQSNRSGVATAYDLLGPENLLNDLAAAGYEIIDSSGRQ